MQIDRINNIYKDHSFGVCGSGFGFEIKQVGVPLFDELHILVFTGCTVHSCDTAGLYLSLVVIFHDNIAP